MPTLDQAIKNALYNLRHSDDNAGMCHCAAEELEAAWDAECSALSDIFNVLYLDLDDEGDSYNPDKECDSDHLAMVAEIVRPFFAHRFAKEGD